MINPNGESDISLGSIAERAEKLEITPEEKAPESKPEEKAPEEKAPETKPEEKKPEPKPEEKKAPNDPDELRKWNTKVSMELSEIKKQHAETVKQLQVLADALSKENRQKVDWKELAKDPAKLQQAVEAQQKALLDEQTKRYDENQNTWVSRYTTREKDRRMHDPDYPRWGELLPVIMNMAARADSRINFDLDPDKVLDSMYETAQQDVAKDPNYKAPQPPAAPRADFKYTEQDLQAKVAEAVKRAQEEAAKGLKAEESAAGVGAMGKGAPKGKSNVDKKALWEMPLNDLKSMVQQATDK